MKYLPTTHTYRSTGRSFTFVITFRIPPNDSKVCSLDSTGYTWTVFDFLNANRTGVNDNVEGGSGVSGGGGGGDGGGGSGGGGGGG